MQCPNCGSPNINVQVVQDKAKKSNKGVGVGGNINNAARATTAVCTLGLSNIFWKKSKGSDKMKFKNNTMAVCQNCGTTWEVK